MYSTGNYTQYPMTSYKGKEYLKKNTSMCMTEPFHCTAEVDTTL